MNKHKLSTYTGVHCEKCNKYLWAYESTVLGEPLWTHGVWDPVIGFNISISANRPGYYINLNRYYYKYFYNKVELNRCEVSDEEYRLQEILR